MFVYLSVQNLFAWISVMDHKWSLETHIDITGGAEDLETASFNEHNQTFFLITGINSPKRKKKYRFSAATWNSADREKSWITQGGGRRHISDSTVYLLPSAHHMYRRTVTTHRLLLLLHREMRPKKRERAREREKWACFQDTMNPLCYCHCLNSVPLCE